jgi:hypothetical protein
MCVFCCSVRSDEESTYCDSCQDHGYTPIEEAMEYLDFTEQEKQDWRKG